MPLLMDTPFGRLSGENRDNLLSYLPKKTSQWIFLATDTELTKVEANVLRNTGKWGEAHELVLVNQGMTRINRFENPLLFTPKR